MEREHAQRVAELEAAVKRGQEDAALRTHSTAEEVARTFSDPHTLGLIAGLLQQTQAATPAAAPKQEDEDFLSPGARQELTQVWSAVDVNSDGHLTCEELRKVFDEIGPNYTDEEWQSAFAQIDRTFTGHVTFGASLQLIIIGSHDSRLGTRLLWCSLPPGLLCAAHLCLLG
jgi:hypothetical protein